LTALHALTLKHRLHPAHLHLRARAAPSGAAAPSPPRRT
jgi:hypothetical protein